MLTNRFSTTRPVCCAQGRYGELIVVQGYGVRPARWGGTGAAVDAGMDAPTHGPYYVYDGIPRYYVARVDISKPGACYYAPPTATLSSSSPPGPGGRPAVVRTFLGQGSLTEAVVEDGGKFYPEPPAILLGGSHGSGAVLTATLATGSVLGLDPPNNPFTGISEWQIIQAPDFLDEGFLDSGDTWYYAFDGATTISLAQGASSGPAGKRIGIPSNGLWHGSINCASGSYQTGFTYTVTNPAGSGIGASVRLVFSGGEWVCNYTGVGGSYTVFRGARTLVSASVAALGKDYSPSQPVSIRIPAASGSVARDIILEGYTAGSTLNTAAPGYSLAGITITNAGSGYLVAPQIKILSDSGFGAHATCTVKDGKIHTVTLENAGAGYKTPPTIVVVAGGAEAFAVARPHMRGKYQCYSRVIDSTSSSRGGPIPSSLSPVTEVDTGEGAASITWTPGVPAGRAVALELWRTTSNQATTLYRVYSGASPPGTTFVDTLTDEEVRDPDRAGYAAMPIVLPNGEINANRFTPPPSDKAVVVRFQDRFWYAVDTSGKEGNTLRYSEVDEPESVPSVNEIVVQHNSRRADAIRALIPFGPTLLVMQAYHAYSLTFAKNPLLDAQVSPIAYRGAVNQRCWDIHAGACYVMDQAGVYSITQAGATESLSDAIGNLFRESIDWSHSTWPFVVVDPATQVLRAFVAFKGDNSDGFPTRALCYHIDSKTWWVEMYPHRITSATVTRIGGDLRCVYGGSGGFYLLDEGATDLARGAVTTVTLTATGSGYTKPPAVTAAGGTGAAFRAVLNDSGGVASIWILSTGFGYAAGSLTIAPPDGPGGVQATATFTATATGSDSPVYPTYRYKSGAMAYSTDGTDPKAGSGMARGVTVFYAPQPSACTASMRLYYNDSKHPRRNIVQRNRGIGFVADTVDPAHRLDLGANTSRYGEDAGAARAVLEGRTMEDVASADRHVAVELSGARKTAEPVVFYAIEQRGDQRPEQ